MMASTSARAARAQTSLVRAAVPVAAGDPVGLAPVPAGDEVAVPVGEVVAVVAVGVGDAVVVAAAEVGVGEAPEVPPGEHAVTKMSAVNAMETINGFLMRYIQGNSRATVGHGMVGARAERR
jgi:hypothetical protein